MACVFAMQLNAQQKCVSSEYLSKEFLDDLSFKQRAEQIEIFTKQKTTAAGINQRDVFASPVIRIPVVFHVLYRTADEDISIQKILDQLDALNRDYRRKNADTINTPSAFKQDAADMEIEFQLAGSDPMGRSTSGIVRKYTPVTYWMSDDKIKFDSSYGDNAWDSKSYLNIWICNLKDVLGYSTFPGQDPKKDGVVLDYKNVLGNGASMANKGRTIVHEVGHWLNLKHIWGDTFCGDDNVDDTPKQSTYTPGCPGGTRISCSNAPTGDMYMNYMDFTDDGCMNMFSKGQKQRARVLFDAGGPRNSIRFSQGFNQPTAAAAALPDFYPRWYNAEVYPNPATDHVNIYFDYDERWQGKELQVIDMTGKLLFRKKIDSKVQRIDLSHLQPGVYIIKASKENEAIAQKFIKL